MRERRSHGEGTIAQRGPNKWRLRYEGPPRADGARRQYSLSVRGTKGEALKVLRDRIRALEVGAFVRPTRQTVGQYLAEWLDRHAQNVAPITRHGYARIIRTYLNPGVGGIELQRLEPSHLADMYAELLARGLHPQTVTHAHRVMRKCLADAMRLNLVPRNVADAVDAPRVGRRHMNLWTPAEINRFLDAAADSPFHDFFHVAVLTGMRRSEIAALRWESVNLDARTLRVTETLLRVNGKGLVRGQPKSERSRRVIALGVAAVDLLRRVRVRQLECELAAGRAYQHSGHVFTDPLGQPFDADRASKELLRIVRAVNVKASADNGISLPYATLHSLRHAHASLLLAQGVHVKVLSERLGHASVAFTLDTYAHLLPGLQEKAADAIDTALARA